jgi:zinc and cadmium transporter
MTTFLWIVLAGIAMTAISLIGSVVLVLDEATLRRLLLPLVAFAAGSLMGGALFHMIPAALHGMPVMPALGLVALGFLSFFGLEQFLHWHHCHRASAQCKKPLTYLILIGDALHNFLGGLAVAGVFLVDVRLGIAAWVAAAADEVPQELGDFAVLVHGGWDKRTALLFNLLSGSAFLVGGIAAYVASLQFDVRWLVPLAAGNFLYIGASDLVPEVNKSHSLPENLQHFVIFAAGLGMLFAMALFAEPHTLNLRCHGSMMERVRAG